MATYTTRSKRFRVGAFSLTLCILVTAIVVVLNLVVDALPTRLTHYDTSTVGYYDISEGSQAYLAALNEEITIYLIDEFNGQDPIVSELVERIASCSSRITVKQIDPVVNPTFVGRYTTTELTPSSLIIEGSRRSRVVDYYEIFSSTVAPVTDSSTLAPDTQVITDEKGNLYAVLSTQYAGEAKVLSAIDYVLAENVPVMYQLSGHGETSLDATFASYLTLDNIIVAPDPITMTTSTSIPENCDLLLIHQPTSDFSQAEISFLKGYLSRGGRILLISTYAVDLPNLYGLMSTYGADFRYGLAVESSSLHYISHPLYIVPTILPSPIASLASAQNKPTVVLVGSHAITLNGKQSDTVTVTPLFESSEGSFLKDPADATTSMEKGSSDPLGPFCIGAMMEDSESGAGIVWIAATFFANNEIDRMMDGANSDMFLSIANYLAQKESSMMVSVKTIENETLTFSSTALSGVLGALLIGVLPLTILGSGFAVWWKRGKH